MAKKNCSKIGGQAVLEGVMMRGKSVSATAVRDPEGNIQVESSRFKPLRERSFWFKVPIIRGVLSFVISMKTGMKTLMRASEVYGDIQSEEPSKFEKWLAKTFKVEIMSVVNFVGIVLGLALSLFLFVFLPNLAADGFFKLVSLDAIRDGIGKDIIRNLFSGAVRISIFVGYIALTSLLKDIKRLYMYHGAEHKTISAFENGLDLTVENVKKMTTVHDRCGTTFMFVVMFISIIFFSFFGWQENLGIRVLIRILGIPVVAGISYELIMLAAKSDNIFAKIFKAPGLLLQKLTTREPDEKMIEVAITAFNTVLKMEEDESIKETRFVTATTLDKAKKDLLLKLEQFEDAEKALNTAELILMFVSGAKNRTELKEVRILSTMTERAEEIMLKYIQGIPLQHAMGEAHFYGYDFISDSRALIPRMDTELLVEKTIKAVEGYKREESEKEISILELCTGSGAVAITIFKELKKKGIAAKITASDISKDALSLAGENISRLEADVELIESNLFSEVSGKYDFIVVNPPYIPSKDIEKLESVVKNYEPHLALDGGEDGLDFYRRINESYKDYLNEGGKLLMEIGIGQSEEVQALFKAERVASDFNTPPIPRVVIVSK